MEINVDELRDVIEHEWRDCKGTIKKIKKVFETIFKVDLTKKTKLRSGMRFKKGAKNDSTYVIIVPFEEEFKLMCYINNSSCSEMIVGELSTTKGLYLEDIVQKGADQWEEVDRNRYY